MDQNTGRREKPRKIISVSGKVRTGRGVPLNVAVIDLSEGGCRVIVSSSWIKEGANVSIRIGKLDPLYATVRWVKDGQLGLEFQTPLYGPVFENIKAVLAGARETPERRSKIRPV